MTLIGDDIESPPRRSRFFIDVEPAQFAVGLATVIHEAERLARLEAAAIAEIHAIARAVIEIVDDLAVDLADDLGGGKPALGENPAANARAGDVHAPLGTSGCAISAACDSVPTSLSRETNRAEMTFRRLAGLDRGEARLRQAVRVLGPGVRHETVIDQTVHRGTGTAFEVMDEEHLARADPIAPKNGQYLEGRVIHSKTFAKTSLGIAEFACREAIPSACASDGVRADRTANE